MRDPARQAREWLAAAARDPRECKRQWRSDLGVAVLACGRFWDVLSVSEDLGVLALDALLGIPQAPGPALADAGCRRVGFFLPPDPDGRWVGQGVKYLGRGTRIATPAPDRTAGQLRWLVPPDGLGTLFVPAAVELALQHVLTSSLASKVNAQRRCPTCGTPFARSLRNGGGRG
ncbi:hypothetical protein AB0I00_19310 [Streptomyces sp. NPDC050803]|uniref:hypothetical protein n=1 Tax=unclassified Streptomyces TaxID=2593676 RepID=UPI00342068E8